MQYRLVTIEADRAAKTAENGDVTLEMSFSSETPYERWWGIEILDHGEKSVRLQRLNDGASVLFNHDWNDLRGVHEPGSVHIDKVARKVRGKVRLQASTQSGRDTIALVESRVLTKSSVGYAIHKVIEQTTSKSGEPVSRELDGALFERLLLRHAGQRGDLAKFRRELDQAAGAFERSDTDPVTYRVIDWEPHENSLVTIPADVTVGVGRSATELETDAPAPAEKPPAKPAKSSRTLQMDQNEQAAPAGNGENAAGAQPRSENAALNLEKQRQQAISNLCKANNLGQETRDKWITTGATLEQVTEDLLQVIEARAATIKPKSFLDLSGNDIKRFSLVRAVLAAEAKDWSQAGFEAECSREVAKRTQKVLASNSFMVPYDIMERSVQIPVNRLAHRDMTVGTAAQGGFLVETANVGFIEMLRNRAVAYRMGARRLPGLVGNVTIPRQSGAATAGWLLNEAATISETNQTLQQVALSPKTVGAYTEISRQLMLQSVPAAEGIVTADLATVAALAVDAGIINGSGASGQPTGIIATAGIGAVTGTSIAYAGIIEFQTDVAGANVMPISGGYATTPTVAGLLMQRVKFTSTASPLWEGNVWDGVMQGFPAMSSLQIPAANILFGDWAQVLVGEWGDLQIDVNPYANFQGLLIGIRAVVTIDVALRYAGAFSLATSVT